jgi:hypothetical protein
LRVPRRRTVSLARRIGIGASFTVPDAALGATARLYRVRGGRRTLVAERRLTAAMAEGGTVRFADLATRRKLRASLYLVELRTAAGAAVPAHIRLVRSR